MSKNLPNCMIEWRSEVYVKIEITVLLIKPKVHLFMDKKGKH